MNCAISPKPQISGDRCARRVKCQVSRAILSGRSTVRYVPVFAFAVDLLALNQQAEPARVHVMRQE